MVITILAWGARILPHVPTVTSLTDALARDMADCYGMINSNAVNGRHRRANGLSTSITIVRNPLQKAVYVFVKFKIEKWVIRRILININWRNLKMSFTF